MARCSGTPLIWLHAPSVSSNAPLATLPAGIQLNIAARVVPPRVAHRETAILTPARVNVVLETARGRAIFPIATLALAAGMRRGEGLN